MKDSTAIGNLLAELIEQGDPNPEHAAKVVALIIDAAAEKAAGEQMFEARDWDNMPQLLKTEEVARILRLSRRHTRTLGEEGKFSGMKIGDAQSHWRWHRDSVREYVMEVDNAPANA